MSEMPAIEIPRTSNEHGSGRGSGQYFKLEARTSYSSPIVLGKYVIDNVWRVVPINTVDSPIAVSDYDRETLKHGLMTQTVAEAFRWGLLAALRADMNDLCIETRLVECRYEYTYKVIEIGVTEPLKSAGRQKLAVTPRVAGANPSEQEGR